MGKMETLTPCKIETLEQTDTQFVRIDYVQERNVCSKFGKNPFTGNFWAKGWNNFLCDFFIYLFINFFSDQRREDTPGRILTRNGSKDAEAESRKDVPFGVIKRKIEIWPLFTPTPKTSKIWPWIGNFQPKWWNMKLQVYQKVLNQSRRKFNTMLGT